MFMHKLTGPKPLAGALLALGMAAAASPPTLAGDIAADPITVTAIAEVETKISRNGHDAVKLVPANRVVPGDQVIYTLEIRNTGAAAVPAPSVAYAVPAHMRYVADSAVGPGAEVSYSIDGGRTFDRPENLMVAGPAGQPRPADAADYTHIRWQLKNSLKGNSVAFARFRAVVK
jgi:uncharacterized repeat protein (TIGR01451 family)